MPEPIDDDVLDAVARVLARGGVRDLSITSIAEEAGLSRVTLHRRGAKLDDYLVGVLGRASDDLRASLWPVLTAPGRARERLATALEVLCAVCERHAGVMTALFAVPPRPLPGGPTTSRFACIFAWSPCSMAPALLRGSCGGNSDDKRLLECPSHVHPNQREVYLRNHAARKVCVHD